MKFWLLIAFHFPFFRLYPSPFLLPFPSTHPLLCLVNRVGHQISITPWNALQFKKYPLPPPPTHHPLQTPLASADLPKNYYCFVNHHTHTPKILKPVSLSLHTVVLLFSLTLHSKLFMNPCKVSVHPYCCFSTMIPPLPHPPHPSSLSPPPPPPMLRCYTAFSSPTQL